tara:strand:+ start:9889 stop:10155 length:267 start_codon:yes stop_codon:yes gene_type:complete
MSKDLAKKIIDLESKFSLLIKKYNNILLLNEELKKKIEDKDIELVIKNFQIKNSILSSDKNLKTPLEFESEINDAINELDNLIKNLKE